MKKILFIIFILSFKSYSQNSIDNIVGSTITIQSKIMNDEREIQISLPNDYTKTDLNYPVLYILDGQRYFLHGVSLKKSFVEFNQTPEFIIIGISKNKSDRNRNFSTNSEKYLEFIKREVISYIDTTYRTSKKRILFGWAYGGGFVIETILKEPNIFDVYIAASPFPLGEKIKKMNRLFDKNPGFNKLLYFSSGTKEGVVKEGTKELSSFLTKNAPKTMNWTFNELQGEEHRSTPFTTLYHGIKEYYSYYPELQFSNLDEFNEAGGLNFVYNYYRKRASDFGFSDKLSDWTMFSLTRNAMRANNYNQFNDFIIDFIKTGFIQRLKVSRSCSIAEFYLTNKKPKKAIELFSIIAKNHPKKERPLKGLGDSYKALKEKKKASLYYEKVKKLSKND